MPGHFRARLRRAPSERACIVRRNRPAAGQDGAAAPLERTVEDALARAQSEARRATELQAELDRLKKPRE